MGRVSFRVLLIGWSIFLGVIGEDSEEQLSNKQDDNSSADTRIDCYLQTVENSTLYRKLLSDSNLEDEELCRPGFFRLPDESFREGRDDLKKDEEFLRTESESLENLILCCPKVTQQERVFSFRPVLWPNEKKGTLSRAFMECHTTDIPGIDTIRYFLYTKKDLGVFDYHELDLDSPATFITAGFLKKAPVKIIIHGFMSSAFIGPAPYLRSAYATMNRQMNVISVNWETLANLATASGGICYDVASQSTRLVGQKTAKFIEYLVKHGYTTLDKVHVLGHSLGAHCAGFTGKFLTIGKLPRITGFDPARPQFDDKGPRDRLDFSDANFVDVIHTATTQWRLLGALSGGLLPFPVGLRTPVGHKDFYPNKGTHQPGCYLQLRKLPVLCSHSRSYAYYADSIRYRRNKGFIADKCKSLQDLETGVCSQVVTGNRVVNRTQSPSTLVMGEFTSTNPDTRQEIYFVRTDYKSPFPLDIVKE